MFLNMLDEQYGHGQRLSLIEDWIKISGISEKRLASSGAPQMWSHGTQLGIH